MHKCRACGGNDIIEFLNLGGQPLVNTPSDSIERYPLSLHHCSDCAYVFSSTPRKPSEIFTDYSYLSSASSDWISYCSKLCREILSRHTIEKDSSIVEIASNDGYMLHNFKELGFSHITGIEPSVKAAEIARARGIPTIDDFFTNESTLRHFNPRSVSLVIALNVLAHVPDINDFILGISNMLSEDGIAVIQFHYLPDLIQKRQFDTIYHEHFSYLCLSSIERVFAAAGLRIFDAVRTPVQGGSLRLYACLDNNGNARNHPVKETVSQMLEYESFTGVRDHSIFRAFASNVHDTIDSHRKYLTEMHESGSIIAGYGAAAKAVIFLNSINAGRSMIPCIADVNEIKQGRLLPGTDIPVVSPEEMLEINPDHILIFPWNLRDEIAASLRSRYGYKGRFLVFSPDPEIFR